MRSSEAISALLRGFNTLNSKSRVQRGTFSNGESSELCAPFLPDMLPGGDPTKICTVEDETNPGRQWYCQKPTNGTCENLDPETGKNTFELVTSGSGWPSLYKLWIPHLTDTLSLDNVYEDLIFEGNVTVNEQAALFPSDVVDRIPGYWYNQKWYDRVYEDMSWNPNDENQENLGNSGNNKKRMCKAEYLTNKKFILLGDSIGHQLWLDIDDEIRYYTNQILKETQENIIPKVSHFDFLGLNEDYSTTSCEEPGLIPKWGPFKQEWPAINFTMYSANHGEPLFKNTCMAKAQYSADVIKRMIEHKWFSTNEQEYIVLLNHGAHFATMHPLIFHNRLIEIRNSIIEYKKHSPKTTFIFKTLNYARGNFTKMFAITSAFQAIRQREIAFNIFGNPYENDMRSDKFPVKVLDVFPMTFAAFDFLTEGNIHPRGGLNKATSDALFNLLRYVRD